MKIAVTCGPTSQHFLPPVERLLREGGHEVKRFTLDGEPSRKIAELREWGAAAVWHEWADAYACALAWSGIPTVVRMHRYEAETTWPSAVKWGPTARLLVTSKHILARAERRSPGLTARARAIVIPSIVDFEAFPLQTREDANALRVAVVGLYSGRKQTGLAVEAARALANRWNVEMDLVGRCDPAEPFWDDYLRALPTKELTVVCGSWENDVASMWAKHDVCLSTSADEGCPYNVIEAMASGALPLVHHYPGAEAQFPSKLLWRSLEELVEIADSMIGARGCLRSSSAPGDIRAWAAERYSIEANRDAVLGLFR